jgi:hypothetical protein
MSKQNKTPWPCFSALWSVLWRAVLLMPFAIFAGGLWLMIWPLLILLPFCEILFLLNHEWLEAGIVPLIWIALFIFTRFCWFKANRKDFPNEQENV